MTNHGTKPGNTDFDLQMSCCGEVEVCEIVSICILNKMNKIMDEEDLGLRRDCL